jgi:hypothetical protein
MTSYQSLANIQKLLNTTANSIARNVVGSNKIQAESIPDIQKKFKQASDLISQFEKKKLETKGIDILIETEEEVAVNDSIQALKKRLQRLRYTFQLRKNQLNIPIDSLKEDVGVNKRITIGPLLVLFLLIL